MILPSLLIFLLQSSRLAWSSTAHASSFFFPQSSLSETTLVGPTAPVERAHSDRARSGSTGPI